MNARSRFVDLLDRQFRHLGRDVEHETGNLLLRVGFVRETPPGGQGVARYRGGAGASVILWRCGALLIRPEGDCLAVRGTPAAVVPHGCLLEVWDLEQVRARVWTSDQPCPFPALAALCHWFATYERSVATVVGTTHRSGLRGHPASPPTLVAEWTQLHRHLAATVHG